MILVLYISSNVNNFISIVLEKWYLHVIGAAETDSEQHTIAVKMIAVIPVGFIADSGLNSTKKLVLLYFSM